MALKLTTGRERMRVEYYRQFRRAGVRAMRMPGWRIGEAAECVGTHPTAFRHVRQSRDARYRLGWNEEDWDWKPHGK